MKPYKGISSQNLGLLLLLVISFIVMYGYIRSSSNID
jgi:hypothetical protein